MIFFILFYLSVLTVSYQVERDFNEGWQAFPTERQGAEVDDGDDIVELPF
jgi:hypothetical protein